MVSYAEEDELKQRLQNQFTNPLLVTSSGSTPNKKKGSTPN